MRPPFREPDKEVEVEILVEGFVEDSIEGMTPEEYERDQRRQWEEKLQVFGDGVEAEAEEFERLRKPIELRMLEDMRQYMGVEQADSRGTRVDDRRGSEINVNITRKKTNSADARLSDMLFGDKNWVLEPTPIPDLAIEELPEEVPESMRQHIMGTEGQQQSPPPQAQPQPEAPQGMQPPGGAMPGMDAAAMMTGATPGAPMTPDGQPVAQQQPSEQITEAEQRKRNAKARAEAMDKEIDDQLTECNYSAVGREAIRFGCILGTGVIKGPVLMGKSRRVWVEKKDESGNSAWVLRDVADPKPGYEFVSTWDFFPDMAATRVQDCEVIFQRHWMTRRDLIRLSKRDDFLPDQIRRVLRQQPNRIPPDYLTQLRAMSDVTAVGDEKRYVVWERHGPVSREDLVLCGALEPEEGESDPLEEYQGVVFVCQGIVIKAAINPMDTEDIPFSVFNFEKDDSSIFGFGIPFLMRQPQKVVRLAWQMIMDNAGLTVGGQVLVNKQIVEPAPDRDGRVSWEMTPLKMWLLKDRNARAQDAFHIFEFPNHQNELAAIFNMARQLADEESGIPLIAEGEQGQHVTQTAHGMEMLMNSSNVVMRRAVSNWDDDVTIPCITRIYDWNMQNNPKNDIKGDFTPNAVGSKVLLQKETQARNILNLVNFLMTPALMPWTKIEPMVRKLVQAMQHDDSELIKDRAEYEADMAKMQAAQQQGQGADPKVEVEKMRADLQYKIHQEKLQNLGADRQFKAAIVDKEHEIAMMKLAQDEKVSLQKLAGQLQAIREKIQGDRAKLADETKVKVEFGSGL